MSCEATYASLLYIPEMRITDVWVLLWRKIHAKFQISDTTAVTELTLERLDQPSASVLSTFVEM